MLLGLRCREGRWKLLGGEEWKRRRKSVGAGKESRKGEREKTEEAGRKGRAAVSEAAWGTGGFALEPAQLHESQETAATSTGATTQPSPAPGL